MQQDIREVIAYEDDVYVWVFLDQIDRVLRYEAYVIDYDDGGEPTTLRFVIEEGVLDNLTEVEFLWAMLREHICTRVPACVTAPDIPTSLEEIFSYNLHDFYTSLTPAQLARIHDYFAVQEAALKKRKKARWVRALRALGYDVIDRAC